ncbi:histone H1-like [Sceloporus undulatus]|uniref:histone H1-like n=1 Tax=Sceloporus undulatus TaxID=8520 RepID=UPI001C4A9597|nr:histone H1-like [Sceloporus undulatus]
MMESNKFPEDSPIGDSDLDSTDVDSAPGSEDNEPPDVSENTQSADSVQSPTLVDPSLMRGRRRTRTSRVMAPSPSQRAARQLNQTRATAPKLPTTNLSLLIFTAVATCRRRSGLSMQALKKMLTSMGYDVVKKKHYFLRAIKNMVDKGQLWQVKGNGATGSFKVNPDLGKKKHQPKVRGRGQKAKDSTKKKDGAAKPKNARSSTAKKQGKVESSKRVSKRSRIPSLQAVPSQVKV